MKTTIIEAGPYISGVVWLLSLALPVYLESPGHTWYPGILAFGFGPFGLSLIAWVANPLLWAAYVYGRRKNPRAAAGLAAAAVFFGVVGVLILLTQVQHGWRLAFAVPGWIQGQSGWQVGVAVPVWISSMVVAAVSYRLRQLRDRTTSPP